MPVFIIPLFVASIIISGLFVWSKCKELMAILQHPQPFAGDEGDDDFNRDACGAPSNSHGFESDDGLDTGIAPYPLGNVNPANGLPMLAYSELDVDGNAFGTDWNDSGFSGSGMDACSDSFCNNDW